MRLENIFKYDLPTSIVFGAGACDRLAEIVKKLNGTKVLLVSDPGLQQAGVTEQVTSVLQKENLPYVMFNEIEPDPDIEGVMTGSRLAKEHECDCVVGLGGGSALDTAKAIGLMMKNEGHIRDYVGIGKVKRKGAAVIAIPTTAGTGSELTIWSVLSDKAAKEKLSVGSEYNCPDVALCDPTLTVSLPPHLTASTGMDALTHALESYVNLATQPISEALALRAMKLISRSLRVAVAQGNNLSARSDMLLASTMAAMAFNPTRLGLSHALAIPLGARFNIPHGVVNAILLPEVMEFNLIGALPKFKDIAECFDMPTAGLSPVEAAEQAVAAVRRLKQDIGIRARLSDYGVKAEHLDRIAEEAMQSGNVPVNPRQPTLEDLEQICKAAM